MVNEAGNACFVCVGHRIWYPAHAEVLISVNKRDWKATLAALASVDCLYFHKTLLSLMGVFKLNSSVLILAWHCLGMKGFGVETLHATKGHYCCSSN